MAKTKRILVEIIYSVAITIIYLSVYMFILPHVFSRIMGFSIEFFMSTTYVVLALLSTGLGIASRYVVKPVKIAVKLLSATISILILMYVTNNGVLEFKTSYGDRTLVLFFDFSIVLYVAMFATLALSIISAIITDKR